MENVKPNHKELVQMDLDLDFGGIRYHYNETIHLQKHLFYHMLAANKTIKVMGKAKIAIQIQHFLVEIGFASVGLPCRNSTGVTVENDREPSVTNISTGKHEFNPSISQLSSTHGYHAPFCAVEL